MTISQETRLKKAHLILMRHKETALYSGIIMMGTSKVIDDCPTAYTDGINKRYGREFMTKLNDAELRALILHENLHVALKHVRRFKKKMKENAQLMNASADYVVNDVIVSLQDKSLCKLPQGGLVDSRYHDWSVNDVYKDLKKQQKEGKEPELGTLDEHGFEDGEGKELSPQQQQELDSKIERALREGSMLSNRVGGDKGNLPRNLQELLAPKIDWKDVLQEFVSQAVRGKDEYSWRRYDKRLIANDIYMPTTISETVGEIVVSCDLSGSIQEELKYFIAELQSICEMIQPEKLRILWWDTEVSGEQVFTLKDYPNLTSLLKPTGGGGTDPECIPEYISANNINAEAIVVFTDGWFSTPKWNTATPTLFITTDREENVPSNCKVIKQEL
jgi:predicted metal-dependent peptidase